MKMQLLPGKVAGISLNNVRVVDDKTYFEFNVPESSKEYKQWLSELKSDQGCKIKFINSATHSSKVLNLHATSSTTACSAGKVAMLGVVNAQPIHASYKWTK